MLPNYLIVSRAKTLTQYHVQQNKSKNVISTTNIISYKKYRKTLEEIATSNLTVKIPEWHHLISF